MPVDQADLTPAVMHWADLVARREGVSVTMRHVLDPPDAILDTWDKAERSTILGGHMLTTRAITPVYEIMSSAPVCIRTTTTVGELLELFDRHDYNAFPVTDDSNVLVGIVTKLDLLRVLHPNEDLALPDPKGVSAIEVGEVMRPGVINLEGDAPIGVAADLMVETALHSIPVVRRAGGRPELVGMVSRGDVIRGLRFAMTGGG